MAAGIRTYDGTVNNLLHPEWGSTLEQLLRLANPQYANGTSARAGDTLPDARAVSNAIVAHPLPDSGAEQRDCVGYDKRDDPRSRRNSCDLQ